MQTSYDRRVQRREVDLVGHAPPDISVRTLGTFEVTFNGHSVDSWKAGKARSLLQLLLLHHDRVVLRDFLNNALWPTKLRPTGSSSLKVAVHSLRRILQQAQDQHLSGEPSSSLRLLTCESGYMLEARNIWTDHDEFESLIARAHVAQQKNDICGADEFYSQANELYRGDFLPNVQNDWAATQREWLRSRQLCALEFLSTRRLAHGDHVSVIDLCQRMLATDPLHEASYRALISVHAKLGQLSQVRRWYDLCVKRLRDSVQATPDHETQRLYREAIRGNFILRADRPETFRLEAIR